ncbi:hypothetical protein BDP81DRAFT_369288 [Colletotrichum phormii]|uniref:Uncharacterized protein n=1 Tax=Colletotrichum phormii TaxID=359342 RepID=A0AAJ0EGP4_9PEZI|nr:uncharacterized protein BDP81DRAFT_369288 [Colletotrichum phormii]KAK1639547.1 hypothetical protein BDP81DRAFT_369288 [Colletotrichum phormii]
MSRLGFRVQCAAAFQPVTSISSPESRYIRDNNIPSKTRCRIAKTEVKRHTTPGIRWSSPTQLLIRPSLAYLWESGRDPEFSNGYGRM